MLCAGLVLLAVGVVLTFFMVCNTTYFQYGGSSTACATAFSPIGVPLTAIGFILFVLGLAPTVTGLGFHGERMPWSRCAACGAGVERMDRFCAYCGSRVRA